MDSYQRFPKKWKTLGVRWPKRHGVTAPLYHQRFLFFLLTLFLWCRHTMTIGAGGELHVYIREAHTSTDSLTGRLSLTLLHSSGMISQDLILGTSYPELA